ncbi:bifunctional 3,4-dihydroxy-2-butanone-4-phosphate synthase/GTP cyclohydrolase II [Varibaculum massiliense]|uniref:bifunctional 3,4-dihydroxy-2-butanone-4-phosphate synthase/GTP cyclohydrolase II n=1 Tax=Varibaculum massiliense TaxID=1852372 RepID=UPI0008D93AC3|nr:bifunctional 3,4-dihydroxy-2-butanone-4-phosphate synthase/GTP cyclohydrolase II [Varibaculum massiliense]
MSDLAQLFARVSAALRAGKPVLVADSKDRENEVDAIVSAQKVTPEWMGWMVRYTSGYICAPMPAERAELLGLPIQWPANQDQLRTCYTVSCDAARGVTTGISAADRRTTLRALANPLSRSEDLVRPGHILPLRARGGGVFTRAGHTEAAVDLMNLADLEPVAAIGEMVHDDGSMIRYHDCPAIAEKFDLELITVAELKEYLTQVKPQADTAEIPRVTQIATAKLPTKFGDFTVRAYRDAELGAVHIALISEKTPEASALVRVHSECLTGESFGSLRCDCGPQLHQAMKKIAGEGGAIIYLRGQEGRGIGLSEKIKAYALQDQGRDTAQANLDLGWPVDLREYGAAAAILRNLKMTNIRLLTNNPQKALLSQDGIQVEETVPLEVGIDPHNIEYLRTKQRLGHTFHDLDKFVTEK